MIIPHDVKTEAYVLGALMNHGDLLAEIPELTDEYFFRPDHKTVFSAISEIVIDGGTPDLIQVTRLLEERKELVKVGGPGVVTEMIGAALTRNIDYQLGILRDYAARRKIIAAADRMKAAALDATQDADEALAVAGASVLDIDLAGKNDSITPTSAMMSAALAELQRAVEHKGKPRGLVTGYRTFDLWTGGLREGQFMLIAGRPAMGKSALLVNIADKLVNRGVPVLLFSLEMLRLELIQRIVCARCSFDSARLKLGDIDAPEMRRLEHEHMRLAGQPLFIDDEGGLSIMDVRARARRAVKKHGVKLILVDYLQLLSAKNAQSRENEVGFVSRGLKAMAMELKIPVMAAAQLNRQAESRGDNRPKMSDLRDSGQIEADADIVSLLYRPGYYDGGTDPQETQTTEWTIAKHRAGRTGMIPLEWHPPYTRFDTVSDRFTDEPDVPWGEEKAADLFPVPKTLMEVINE